MSKEIDLDKLFEAARYVLENDKRTLVFFLLDEFMDTSLEDLSVWLLKNFSIQPTETIQILYGFLQRGLITKRSFPNNQPNRIHTNSYTSNDDRIMSNDVISFISDYYQDTRIVSSYMKTKMKGMYSFISYYFALLNRCKFRYGISDTYSTHTGSFYLSLRYSLWVLAYVFEHREKIEELFPLLNAGENSFKFLKIVENAIKTAEVDDFWDSRHSCLTPSQKEEMVRNLLHIYQLEEVVKSGLTIDTETFEYLVEIKLSDDSFRKIEPNGNISYEAEVAFGRDSDKNAYDIPGSAIVSILKDTWVWKNV